MCTVGLATVLERANPQIFTVEFQKIFLFFLWVLTCIKVGDNCLVVKCKGAVSLREGYPVQIKPILFELFSHFACFFFLFFLTEKDEKLLKRVISTS